MKVANTPIDNSARGWGGNRDTRGFSHPEETFPSLAFLAYRPL